VTAVRLGTRGSPLARVQARAVADRIRAAGGPTCEIVVIRTSGDRLANAPLSEVGGKRLFVKEIEDALLSGAIDLAVHSSKDMPAELVEGLEIGAVLSREDPTDVLILPESAAPRPEGLAPLVACLGPSPRIGTGSVRRVAQLRGLFPAAGFEAIRGNLNTRFRKLDKGDYDLLVLAAAGIRRLGLASRISVALPVSICVPAPGQGIIAIETRADDHAVRGVVAGINDEETAVALVAERALVIGLGGGCQMPIGALAVLADDSTLDLHAVVTSLDGTRVVRCRQRGPRVHAAALGADVARRLMADGALDILNGAHGTQAAVQD
jgi:hydroxymethylbilane synthase